MLPRPARKAINAYHHGDLRDALVQAALHQVELGGPEAISISALAKTLGVSQPAPYKHFADRESLLMAVTAEAFRQFSAMLREAIQLADEISLGGLAASGRIKLGGLLATQEGGRLRKQGAEWLAEQGVVEPLRFADVLVPGFWP